MKTSKEIKAAFPKGFKAEVSKTGLNVLVTHKINGDWDKANDIVSKIAKKLGLEEIGSGTNTLTYVRDWEFIVKETENAMYKEACNVLKTMKAFFKKWTNAYCDSAKTFNVVEQMRTFIQSDEA